MLLLFVLPEPLSYIFLHSNNKVKIRSHGRLFILKIIGYDYNFIMFYIHKAIYVLF